MKIKNIILTSALAISLAGCANDPHAKQNAGTVIGGITGAIIGSQFGGGEGKIVTGAIGALAGSMIGNSIGASMDAQDRSLYSQAAQRSFENSPSGTPVSWNNPDSGNYGTVTPIKTFQNTQGMYCREYSQTIVVGGKKQAAYGTACRQPDGEWKIIQ